METLRTSLRPQAAPAAFRAAHYAPMVHIAATVAHRPWTPSGRSAVAFPSLVAFSLSAKKQAVAELSSIATPLITPGTLSKLDVGAAGDFPINDYGDYGQRLSTNKVRLFNVADKMYRGKGKEPYSGKNAQRKAVMMAIAMLETQHMDVNERDKSKDFTPAANNTIFNLNYDMLNYFTGYKSDNYGLELNNDDDATLDRAMNLLDQCFDKAGIERILDFHRGGRTGYDNPAESANRGCDCYVYRNAILTAYNKFNEDPRFLNDSRRIEMVVPYCK